MILSACMMLDHVGEAEKATRIRDAIGRVIKGRRAWTYDMMKLRGGPDAIGQGAATTQQMTDAIIAEL